MSGFPTGIGHYQVRGVLGSGATGTVYLAHQDQIDRDVALKELNPELTGNPAFRERFEADARVMTRLDNPHCVRVFDYFQREEHDYVASELVNGASLRALLSHGGRLTPEQSLGVARDAFAGLTEAHLKGLLHRDVKPENVLVDTEGTSKLADFGQPALVASNGPGAASAGPWGTPAYMAPEVASGSAATVQSDIYSVGAMLFELLTGRPPYVADSPLTVTRLHREEAVPDPRAFNPTLDEGVAHFLVTCLAKDPRGRPGTTQSAMSTMRALAAAAHGEDWETRSSIKRRVQAAVSAGLGLLAGFGAVAAAAAAALPGEAVTAESVYAASTGEVAAPATEGPGLNLVTWMAAAGVATVLLVGGVVALATGLLGGSGQAPSGAFGAAPSPDPSLTDIPPSPGGSATPAPSRSASPTISPSPSPSGPTAASPSLSPSPGRTPTTALPPPRTTPTPHPTPSLTASPPSASPSPSPSPSSSPSSSPSTSPVPN